MAPPASVSFPMCFSRSTGGVGVSTGTLREFLLAWRAGADKTPSPPPLGYALRWRRSETRVLIIELLEDSRAGGGQPAPTWRLCATGEFFCALLSLPSQISPAKGFQPQKDAKNTALPKRQSLSIGLLNRRLWTAPWRWSRPRAAP